jgi:hypothetical protein
LFQNNLNIMAGWTDNAFWFEWNFWTHQKTMEFQWISNASRSFSARWAPG